MNTNKELSPFARLWAWAADYHSGFYGAVALAVFGVACNMLAYFCIAAMIRLLLTGSTLEGFPGAACCWRRMRESPCFPAVPPP